VTLRQVTATGVSSDERTAPGGTGGAPLEAGTGLATGVAFGIGATFGALSFLFVASA